MASLMQEQEETFIYGNDPEVNSGLSSEKVQGMANSIYSEFKRMMSIYGEDAIKELMPLIVTILEALDRSLTDSNENVVEIEMLRDDNEQLATQFERERQLRRTAEQQLLESEDHHEVAARELRSKSEGLETTTRHLELKCKNYTDQIERLQERESEIRKEYSVLHDRHTEMIQSYAEHLERTKILQQQQSYTDQSQSPRHKKEFPFAGSTPSPVDSAQAFTPGSSKNPIQTPDISRSGFHSTPSDPINESNFSLKDELPISAAQTPVSDSMSYDGNLVRPANIELASPSVGSEEQAWVSSEVKDILENSDLHLQDATPEEGNPETTVESTGIENAAFDKTPPANESSLFAELTQQDINDVDEGADILGMSKEVENLISENTKLLATKNALNVVKDDLIQQVDQLTTQQTLLKEELGTSEKTKVELTGKLRELEKQVNKLQQELNNVASGPNENSSARKADDDDTLPMSQRKRFTRVEMARVLMERNQYKERLMELQEAVRWTETLRASRAHADMNQAKTKNKSTIFQFFSRLFTSSGGDSAPSPSEGRRGMRRSFGSGDVGINMSYNVPSSKVLPRSRSTQISMYGRSPTIDTLREEPQIKQELSKREIPAKLGDNRLQACGWSLPNSPSTPKDSSRTVPVPVYCGPMLQNDMNMKLWCATAVNECEGRTKDGGVVVGSASVFYDKTSDQIANDVDVKNRNDLPAVVSLDQEIKNENSELVSIQKQQRSVGSLVWMVAGDMKSGKNVGGNIVHVINACEPNKCTDRFHVGTNDTNILCIASVPGANVDDFNYTDRSTTAEKNNRKFENGSGEKVENKSSTSPGLSPAGEVATEATEELIAPNAPKKIQDKGVTEHIFIDPSSIHPTSTKSSNPKLSDNSEIGNVESVQTPIKRTNDWTKGDADTSAEDTRLVNLQPTVWLGAQNGYVYVYSAITTVKKCLHQLRLKDSVLAIVHLKGHVLAGLADGTVAFFRRHDDGVWNLSNYHLLDLGRPHHSIRCMAVVYDHVWCAYRNKIHVVKPWSKKIQASFDAHPRSESQVRQLAWEGDGVWLSIRLDSTVRLYHARTFQHLQDVDVEPYVSKVLGSGKLGFSFVRITALMISNHRLWIGTGNGVVMSVPLSEGSKSSSSAPVLSSSIRDRPGGVVRVYSDPISDKITPGTFIPYCSMANAQLSFHGFKDAVKFFVAVPGCVTLSTTTSNSVHFSPPKSSPSGATDGTLVLSGGGGYVDFRKGDLGALSPEEKKIESMKLAQGTVLKSQVIVWQLTHS